MTQNMFVHKHTTYFLLHNTNITYIPLYTGKSYSMTGNSTAPGIIPRAISEIFSIIETTTTATATATTASNEAYFYVRLSYVELYNNNFRNLLELSSGSNSNSASSSGTSYPMSSARDNYPNHTNNNSGGEPMPTPRSSYTGSSVAKLGDLEDRFNQGMYRYIYV